MLVDTAPDSYEMDYDRLEAAITERTKAIIPVDLGGVICDYDRLYAAVENKKKKFRPSSPLQEALGRIAVVSDAAHAFGAQRKGKVCGEIADFTTFSFHAVKNLTTGEGGRSPGVRFPGWTMTNCTGNICCSPFMASPRMRWRNQAGRVGVRYCGSVL